MGFMMIVGTLIAVFLSPIHIEAKESTLVKKEFSNKKKKGCPCGKRVDL